MARDDYKRILKRRVGQIEEELDPELGIRENMVNAYLKSFPKKAGRKRSRRRISF